MPSPSPQRQLPAAPSTPPRASSPNDSDDDDNLRALAAADSSPIRPPNAKRTRPTGDSDDEDRDDDSNDPQARSSEGAVVRRPAATHATNGNMAAYAQRLATRKKLRVEQGTELESFALADPMAQRTALLAELFALSNDVKKIVQGTPQYVVSESLKKNIDGFTTLILLSSKISSYTGDVPKTLLETLLITKRFDLPQGIERVPSDWGKVQGYIGYSYTQLRALIKRYIRESVGADAKTPNIRAPDRQHETIYELTQRLVKGSSIRVTAALCARIAVLRRVWLRTHNKNYWPSVNQKIASMRQIAKDTVAKPDNTKTEAEVLAKLYKDYLKKDRKRHGQVRKDDIIDNDILDEAQEEVDHIIEGVGATTTTADAAEE